MDCLSRPRLSARARDDSVGPSCFTIIFAFVCVWQWGVVMREAPSPVARAAAEPVVIPCCAWKSRTSAASRPFAIRRRTSVSAIHQNTSPALRLRGVQTGSWSSLTLLCCSGIPRWTIVCAATNRRIASLRRAQARACYRRTIGQESMPYSPRSCLPVETRIAPQNVIPASTLRSSGTKCGTLTTSVVVRRLRFRTGLSRPSRASWNSCAWAGDSLLPDDGARWVSAGKGSRSLPCGFDAFERTPRALAFPEVLAPPSCRIGCAVPLGPWLGRRSQERTATQREYTTKPASVTQFDEAQSRGHPLDLLVLGPSWSTVGHGPRDD